MADMMCRGERRQQTHRHGETNVCRDGVGQMQRGEMPTGATATPSRESRFWTIYCHANKGFPQTPLIGLCAAQQELKTRSGRVSRVFIKSFTHSRAAKVELALEHRNLVCGQGAHVLEHIRFHSLFFISYHVKV
jgi:hypothetical protein